MTKWTALMASIAVGALFTFAADTAWADSCETYPGSQVYTDQCGPGQEQKPPAAAPAPQQPQGESLRDRLFRALSGGGSNGSGNQSQSSTNGKPQTAEQPNQRVLAAPEPDQPKTPDNVMAQGGNVYVCDSPVSGSNPSCREISPSGECTGVTLSDGEPGWRDSTATPCEPGDLDQRQAFLNANPDAADAVKNADPAFKMDAAGTDAEIARLTAQPPPDRAVDDGEKKDWDAAAADTPTPSIDHAYKETPLDVSSVPAPGNNNGGSDLDDAIDSLNALSSMLGSMSRMATPTVRTPTVSAPTVRAQTPVFTAPTYTYHPQPTTNAPTITGTTGN